MNPKSAVDYYRLQECRTPLLFASFRSTIIDYRSVELHFASLRSVRLLQITGVSNSTSLRFVPFDFYSLQFRQFCNFRFTPVAAPRSVYSLDQSFIYVDLFVRSDFIIDYSLDSFATSASLQLLLRSQSILQIRLSCMIIFDR